MSDLISRRAAIDVLEERIQANGHSNIALVSELNRSIGYLMRLPSADEQILSRLLAELTHKERTDRYHVWTTSEVKLWIADKITEMKNDG